MLDICLCIKHVKHDQFPIMCAHRSFLRVIFGRAFVSTMFEPFATLALSCFLKLYHIVPYHERIRMQFHMLPYHRCLMKFAWLLLVQNCIWIIPQATFKERDALNSDLGYDNLIYHYIVLVFNAHSHWSLALELHHMHHIRLLTGIQEHSSAPLIILRNGADSVLKLAHYRRCFRLLLPRGLWSISDFFNIQLNRYT